MFEAPLLFSDGRVGTTGATSESVPGPRYPVPGTRYPVPGNPVYVVRRCSTDWSMLMPMPCLALAM